MTITIATLKAAGLTADQIVEVLEVAERTGRETRREQNRINQANKRERDRHHVSADVADTADRADTHIDTSLTSSENKKERKRKNISIAIAAEWSLSPDDRAYARSKGWPDDRIISEAERFHNHYLASGKPQKSWPATWRKWVTSPYQRAGPTAGNAPRPGSREDRAQRTHDALTKLKQFANGHGSDDFIGPSGQTNQSAPRRLPGPEST